MGQIMRRTNRRARVVVRVHAFLASAALCSKTVSQCATATVAGALVAVFVRPLILRFAIPKSTVRPVIARNMNTACCVIAVLRFTIRKAI